MQEFGYTLFEFAVPVDSVNFKLHKTDNNQRDFILRGFSIENEEPGFYFASMGVNGCLLYTSPSPRDRTRSRMPSSA